MPEASNRGAELESSRPTSKLDADDTIYGRICRPLGEILPESALPADIMLECTIDEIANLIFEFF